MRHGMDARDATWHVLYDRPAASIWSPWHECSVSLLSLLHAQLCV